MTDETNDLNLTENSENLPARLETDEFDIDAALASVASLSDVIAEREAEEAAEQARLDAETRAKAEAARRRSEYYFPSPPAFTLHRGQLASVVPALLLMAFGAWLSFALATDATLPSTPTVVLLVMGLVGVALLAHWVSSARWLRGSLFGGLALLFSAVPLYALSLGVGAAGWPLLLAALGAAMLLSTVLSSEAERGLSLFTSLLMLLMGAIGYAVTTAAFTLELAEPIAWGLVAVIAAILIIPALLRRS
ncbi:MAG: hypothetical protein OHK0046_40340 [Anaerolineae bacterium]